MASQGEWWQTFYAGHYVDFHRDAVGRKQTSQEVDFMLNLLRLPVEASVLDLGCGEGRHAIEMAKHGCHVTAVDLTEPLLDIARANAAQQQLNIQFEQRDMRNLPWSDSFDAAYCVWGSFGVFDEQGNRELVSAAYRALKPGGRLLIENHIVETLLPSFQTRNWQRISADLVRLEEQRFDHTTSRLESAWLFFDRSTGKIEKQALSMRIYTYHELCDLLQSVGFSDFAGFDTLSGQPFSLGAQRLTLLATKAAS